MNPFYLIVPIFLVASSIALADDTGSTRTIKTDPAGTTVTTDISHTDSVTKSGVVKSTEDEKTVVDPKGLMNKTSAKSHSERTESPKGDFAASNTTTHGNGTAENIERQKNSLQELDQ